MDRTSRSQILQSRSCLGLRMPMRLCMTLDVRAADAPVRGEWSASAQK